jgi:LacI family transcriptional regulator
VILGGHSCTEPVHSVDVDFIAAGKLAVQQLVSRGHRRIAFSGASMRYTYQRELLTGYREGVREGGLDADAQLLQTNEVPGYTRGLNMRLDALLALEYPPTAIVIGEPNHASLALEILSQRGVRVPEDLELIGCEVEGRWISPTPYARVELPFSELGRAGASLLKQIVSRTDDNGMPGSTPVRVPPVFVPAEPHRESGVGVRRES